MLPGSSTALVVSAAKGGGSATVEMATNVYVQASTVQTGPGMDSLLAIVCDP